MARANCSRALGRHPATAPTPASVSSRIAPRRPIDAAAAGSRDITGMCRCVRRRREEGAISGSVPVVRTGRSQPRQTRSAGARRKIAPGHPAAPRPAALTHRVAHARGADAHGRNAVCGTGPTRRRRAQPIPSKCIPQTGRRERAGAEQFAREPGGAVPTTPASSLQPCALAPPRGPRPRGPHRRQRGPGRPGCRRHGGSEG